MSTNRVLIHQRESIVKAIQTAHVQGTKAHRGVKQAMRTNPYRPKVPFAALYRGEKTAV